MRPTGVVTLRSWSDTDDPTQQRTLAPVTHDLLTRSATDALPGRLRRSAVRALG